MTTYKSLSELELIDKTIHSDNSAFETLIRKYNPGLYKIGRSYGFNHQDVEDLMQETYINVYKNLHQLKNKQYFKTWVTKIMLNQCNKRGCKLAQRKEVITDTSSYNANIPMFSNDNYTDTQKAINNRELSQVIENAIAKIPLDYRIIFSLRELNGLNVQETAGLLQITETNVKVRLNRAKVMIRKEIERDFGPLNDFIQKPGLKEPFASLTPNTAPAKRAKGQREQRYKV